MVLSGCETGRGTPRGGGLLGMGRGLLAAGASALLLTLWPVEDENATHLMTDFYESLKMAAASAAHPYVTLALRQAQTAAIARGLSPFYWAGFLLLAG